MVSGYFGLPGSGKTTMLVKKAYDAAFARNPKYDHIYGNIDLVGIPRYIKINALDVGKYMLENCLILIDEATINYDSREYKTFAKELSDWFMTHRHYRADICIFMQSYNGCDKRIRSVMDKLYYLYKSFLTGWYKTKVWRIPYDIIIPDKKDTGSAHLGEIVEGYCKPPFLVRLFTPNLKRKKYYPYFDSWERKELPALPEHYIQEQHAVNEKALTNLQNTIKSLPKWQITKKSRLRKLEKDFKKALTSV